MPRKPQLKKQKITVLVNGRPVDVTLHPPTGKRKSWYAYWAGLVASRSTAHADLDKAVLAAEDMLRNVGRRSTVASAVLTNEEFEEIQRRHFGKRKDEQAQRRAQGTLKDCLEAIAAFREISGLDNVTRATPGDCERFQEQALFKPRNWRQQYPNGREEDRRISPNTVLKWSRQLQAAFERANRNAGKRCIRGVVDETKLLTENPWKGFSWIGGVQRTIRQFDADELTSLLDYFEEKWPDMTVATALAKAFLWSWGRRTEVVSLQWNQQRRVGQEFHFCTLGKRGVEKWFRIPGELHAELERLRTDSPFVFAAYADQLRGLHLSGSRPHDARLVAADFSPGNLGDWFYRRIVEWSSTLPKGRAYLHIFRKTSLQHARRGEDLNREVASDARLTESVMMTNYVRETDEELRRSSNRTFERILRSLGPELAARYGHAEQRKTREELEAAHAEAAAAKDWVRAARIAAELAAG